MIPQNINIGETWLGEPLIAKADGTPIVSGTVNAYVKALSGANAGKWYRNSDSTWQSSETANAMTYQGGTKAASWAINLTNSPFADGILYLFYTAESGDLDVRSGILLRCQTPPVNTTQVSGASQTARDLGASVLLSSGTGTGQLDFTAGILKSNLTKILGTALTETSAGYLAAALKKFLDVAVPVLTAASVNQTIDVSAVKTDTAAIKLKTDNLPALPAATTDIPTAAQNRAELDSNSTKLSAIKTQTDKVGTNSGDSPNTATAQTNAATAATQAAASASSAATAATQATTAATQSTAGAASAATAATQATTAATQSTAAASSAATAATNTTSLPSMIVSNKFTVSALSNAPSGGGGGGANTIEFKLSEVRN